MIFCHFVKTTKATKPNTIRCSENSADNLRAYSKLSGLPMDQITAEQVTGFIERRQSSKVQISTLNRDLATLRGMFKPATE